MQPDATTLCKQIGLTVPLIGFYDAPDTGAFLPIVSPKSGRHACVFAFYKQWLQGKTLHITQENFGCGGAGHWLCGKTTRTREEFIHFLVDTEGLKSSYDLMNQWLESLTPYMQEHPHLFIGPLRESQYQYLKTVTFFVNPDQLGALMLGAEYNNAGGNPPPVIAPFGSGCMQLITLFNDLEIPQAIIGATDIAMRRFLPQDLLAFTVTKPLFEKLCVLDTKSFLYKNFLKELRKAR